MPKHHATYVCVWVVVRGVAAMKGWRAIGAIPVVCLVLFVPWLESIPGLVMRIALTPTAMAGLLPAGHELWLRYLRNRSPLYRRGCAHTALLNFKIVPLKARVEMAIIEGCSFGEDVRRGMSPCTTARTHHKHQPFNAFGAEARGHHLHAIGRRYPRQGGAAVFQHKDISLRLHHGPPTKPSPRPCGVHGLLRCLFIWSRRL